MSSTIYLNPHPSHVPLGVTKEKLGFFSAIKMTFLFSFSCTHCLPFGKAIAKDNNAKLSRWYTVHLSIIKGTN